MTKFAPIGSVSSGTMRPEDLIPTLMDALDAIREELATPGATTEHARETEARKEEVAFIDDLLGAIEQRQSDEDYWDSEDVDCDMERLFSALDRYAAPYCYFGAHEGDGADYGFWISWDSLNDDVHSGEVLKLDAGDDWPDDLDGAEYVLEVNDHGNATLYTKDHKEVWSVV